MFPFVVKTIEDANCAENPFTAHEERDDTLLVLYHGTSSMFSDDIERNGFSLDSFRGEYGEFICAIVDACNRLHLRPDGFATASLLTSVKGKTLWFTPIFRIARHYASNVGSECIDGALRAAQEVLGFVRDSNRVKRQADHWENVLAKAGHHAETQQVLNNLRDSQLIEELTNKVEKAHVFLKDKTKGGIPVVYALLGDMTLDETRLAVLRRRQRDGWGNDVPSSEVIVKGIVGRVDFPNGTTSPFAKQL